MDLAAAMRAGRTIRCVGFDDAPFDRRKRNIDVLVNGAVCAGTRFEGMVSTRVRRDGWNATTRVIESLRDGKFLPQVHLILFDGIALGGFNVLDLEAVSGALGRPCASVMRNEPDFKGIESALTNLSRPARRMELMRRAGPIHRGTNCYFQCVGAASDLISQALDVLTDRGHLPEAIRIAHLVGSAVINGESGNRA